MELHQKVSFDSLHTSGVNGEVAAIKDCPVTTYQTCSRRQSSIEGSLTWNMGLHSPTDSSQTCYTLQVVRGRWDGKNAWHPHAKQSPSMEWRGFQQEHGTHKKIQHNYSRQTVTWLSTRLNPISDDTLYAKKAPAHKRHSGYFHAKCFSTLHEMEQSNIFPVTRCKLCSCPLIFSQCKSTISMYMQQVKNVFDVAHQ